MPGTFSKLTVMIYSKRQIKLAEAIIEKLRNNETSMPKDAIMGFADNMANDWTLENDVLYMLEEDELITYTGNIGWRMQLTNKGCKAAKMGLSQYLKHQDLMDRLNEYKLYINLVCTFITIVSMIITIVLTVVNAVKP